MGGEEVAEQVQADGEKELMPPPAKRQKGGELAPPKFGSEYVVADGGWHAHKGGQWLYNVEEKTYFHLPTGALHLDTEVGLVSLPVASDESSEGGAQEQKTEPVDTKQEPIAAADGADGKNEELPRYRGCVRWFNAAKGYGFISPDESAKMSADIFVHRNQIVVDEGEEDPFVVLTKGALVSFALGETDRGKPCAVQVRIADDEEEEENDEKVDDDLKELEQDGTCDGEEPEGDDESSGSSVEVDLEKELLAGVYTVKGAVKDHCEDFSAKNVKLPISALGETATCIFFGVFDGHGGFTCAEYATAHLATNILSRLRERKKGTSDEVALKTALLGGFKQTEHNFLQHAKKTNDSSGSTACTMTVFGPDENMRLRLYLANIGDSRAVLSRVDGKHKRLTEDHKPNLPAEKKRIEHNGGSVADCDGVWRCILPAKKRLETGIVGLAVSRGFGDKAFKNPDIVSAEPEISVHEVDWDGDEFVILATDGIWDVVTDKMAVALVREKLRAGQSEEQASESLVRKAVERGSKDDCTVLVVRFGWLKTAKATTLAAEGEMGNNDPDGEDDEEADLEAGLTIAPRESVPSNEAMTEDAPIDPVDDLDVFGAGDVDDKKTPSASSGEASLAREIQEDGDDDDDDDDEYELVGGTIKVVSAATSESTGVTTTSADSGDSAVRDSAVSKGLFDDLVPTREELAIPEGPSLPKKALDDDLDMFG